MKAASRRVLSFPLTDEQAEAVATDEDSTLVLAGAGTGKTAVIVGKVDYLVRSLRVPPDQILVLAFNRKAARELEHRLRPSGLSRVRAYTFHSFGLKVIKTVGAAPSVSKLAEDSTALNKTINGVLGDLLADPRQSAAVTNYVLYHHKPYRSMFQFRTLDEYQAYVRSVELRTLNGDLVKSFEELAIANYLTINGVRFCYENPHPAATADRNRRQYQPDFYLPDHDIYIEHFALDKDGKPPGHWENYAAGVEWKRKFHRLHGTTLVETHSWQHSQGVLFPKLHAQLEQLGVRFKPIAAQELIRQLAGETTSRLAVLLTTFLNHAKSQQLTTSQLGDRSQNRADWQRCQSFLSVYQQVRDRYQQMLAKKKEIDFHDMINRATSLIREGRWASPYRYVLVDEFQDISRGRMDLLQAMAVHPQVTTFLVGDDWQSIYRFAGSDISLVSNSGDHLGHTQQRHLTTTYRFGNRILGPSTAFVQRNPDQTQRPLTAANDTHDSGITIIFHPNPTHGVQQALEQINRATPAPKPSVLVLGRYQRSKEALPSARETRLYNLEYSTVHRAKGREADYVIVVDLRDDLMGFPCRIEDDPLLGLVLPSTSGSRYPFAEERRLFYVAMTRARHGTYLIADSQRPSPFVKELLRHSPSLPRVGEPATLLPPLPHRDPDDPSRQTRPVPRLRPIPLATIMPTHRKHQTAHLNHRQRFPPVSLPGTKEQPVA